VLDEMREATATSRLVEGPGAKCRPDQYVREAKVGSEQDDESVGKLETLRVDRNPAPWSGGLLRGNAALPDQKR
jgi:hypothetical protein